MKKRVLSILLAALMLLTLLPVSALAFDGAEDYTVTLVPNLEGLEPIVFRAAEQGDIPYGKESFDEEYDQCSFYWYSEEHPVLCFYFNGTYYPEEWRDVMEADEALRFDGWDATDDLALVSPDTQLNARWTPQRESAFEYELTPHAIRLQPGLNRIGLRMPYGEADRFYYCDEDNEYGALQCYYFSFLQGELESDDGRTIPFYLDRDENGDPSWYYRDSREFLKDAADYIESSGIDIYVSPDDCAAAGSGTFRGRLRMEEMIDYEMRHVGWNSIPVTLTLRDGAPESASYTVRLTPGEGAGEALEFCSADQASIPTGYGSAGNCEFYYEAGSGELRFRLDEDWCPETFSAPEGWSFRCWEQPGYVEPVQELTEVAAQWHVRRERPFSSFALWPESIELTGAENEVELVASELVMGRHAPAPDADPAEWNIPTGGVMLRFSEGELSSDQGSIPFSVEALVTEEYKKDWEGNPKFDRRGELQLVRIALDKSAFASAAPGVYTGVLYYSAHWMEADHISRMEGYPDVSDHEFQIPLTLTVTTSVGETPSQPEPSPGSDTPPIIFVHPDAPDAPQETETDPLAAFSDLEPGAWYCDAVRFCLENGWMNGVGGGRFDPGGAISRAMLVAILYRMENEPEIAGGTPFEDVADGQWYTDAVLWAAENKLVEGFGDGTFRPADSITREQLASILYRYAQSKGQGFSGAWYFPLDYPDAAEVSAWADEAMHWMVMQGVVNGKDGKLVPGGDVSRAEAAAVLARYCAGIAE